MAGGGNAIRGSRVGAGPMGEAERGEAAPRQNVTYFCSHEHRTLVAFAVEAQAPGHLGLPALRPAGEPGLRQPATAPEDRALQDAPRLREGAPLRRRGRRTSSTRRSPPSATGASAATSSSDGADRSDTYGERGSSGHVRTANESRAVTYVGLWIASTTIARLRASCIHGLHRLAGLLGHPARAVLPAAPGQSLHEIDGCASGLERPLARHAGTSRAAQETTARRVRRDPGARHPGHARTHPASWWSARTR